MLTEVGPKLLEYNVRFGDPEAQVVLPRLTSDLTGLLAAAASGDLGENVPTFDDGAAVCVVSACGGYPDDHRTGDLIEGLQEAGAMEDTTVFCAAVDDGGDGRLLTAGGRVVDVVGQGPDLATARKRAYAAAAVVSWPGRYFRRDIAAAASVVL
jgi:phosphoribosylamine--glycine ligase